MPLQCAICRATSTEKTFKCDATPKCKNGKYVNEMKQAPVTYDHAGNAANWNYTLDQNKIVWKNYNGIGAHKPQSTVYTNGAWGISPDVSSHGGNNPAQMPCWKVFHQQGNFWVYWGSYNGDLQQVNRGGGLRESNPPTS